MHVALIALCTFLSFASPYFLTVDNALVVAQAFSLTVVAAIGQTIAIITGGIDLSVGSVLALSGLSTGMLLASGVPLVPAVIAGLIVGMTFGACNGFLITRVGLPPFIATLGMLSIGRGLVYVLTKGYPVTVPRGEELLLQVGQGYVGIVPVPVIIMLVSTVAATNFLSKATLGRYIYAVGGNEE
ncbi:MAG TPA: ABC transporter permease, partial [Thermomicrobiales bacterium]|nr:ABC transporter permease [Thermomicrobiales bacterium]